MKRHLVKGDNSKKKMCLFKPWTFLEVRRERNFVPLRLRKSKLYSIPTNFGSFLFVRALVIDDIFLLLICHTWGLIFSLQLQNSSKNLASLILPVLPQVLFLKNKQQLHLSSSKTIYVGHKNKTWVHLQFT